jgi:hypothetical protein
MNPSTITKGKRGRPSFLKYPDEVSTKIRHDFQTGIILDLDTLIKNILQYDLEAGKKNGDGQISSISASEVQEKTIYAFLRRYNLPSIRDYKSAQRRKMNSDSRVHHKKCIEGENESCTDEEYVSTTTTGFTSTCNKSSVSDEGKGTFFEIFEKESISGEADKPTPESENNTNTQILLRKINQCENDLREKDETIEKLAKLHSSLSSKLSPSPLILSSEAEMAGKRIAYSCIRSLIQVLSPLDSILKWIVIFNNNKNDKTLHTNSGLLLKEDQVPINDDNNNAWFWNTLLNYEAENDKHTELREFETQLQKLCSRNNVSLTKHMTSFIPPPPQKILDLIIQEHHHQKQRSDVENEGEILPFKKINLVPPENTKPFGTVRLKKWRPSTTSDDDNDKGKKATAVAEKAEEILLAEFTWDREKLKYVHMQWPQYKKEVTLKNFYKGQDYEMIGVIFGKQFAGDWRTHELLPHLGLNKYPTSYIFATRREGPLGNHHNSHWYLCFERVHSKPMLFYNFKDV